MTKLRRETCSGAIEGRIDDSHRLRSSNGVVWCEACGAYMTRWPRRLLSECARRPQSVAQKNVLRRLQAGLPPTTAGYLDGIAEEHGAPAAARAHEDEMQWRRGDGTLMAKAKATPYVKPPSGIYARLRGSNAGAGSSSYPPTVDSTPEALSTPTRLNLDKPTCAMLQSKPWTARARSHKVRLRKRCHVCGEEHTLLACRVCDRLVCISCCKKKAACQGMATRPADAGDDVEADSIVVQGLSQTNALANETGDGRVIEVNPVNPTGDERIQFSSGTACAKTLSLFPQRGWGMR